MITVNGKYTTAKIFNEFVEEKALSQVYQFLNHPAFEDKKTRFMSDIHAGAGAVIGTTVELGDKVIPNVIGVDIGCTDGDTEFLTESGWKKISEYKEGDKVLQYNKYIGTASFTTPINYIKKPCDTFYHFRNSKGLDQMVSEEHKMLIWKGYKGRDYVLEDFNPVDLSKRSLAKGYYGIKTAFNISNNGILLTDDEIRLHAMISADGRVREHKVKEGNYIELHLKKERKVHRAKELLEKNNIKYTMSEGNNSDTFFYFTVKKELNKSLSIYWKANQLQLKVLANECLLWDGHQGYRSFFTSTIKENADVIQYAFTANNIRTSISTVTAKKDNWNDVYTVIPTKNNIIGVTEFEKIEVDESTTFKYCFTVPTGYFVIRRNNNVSITGNCGMLSALIPDAPYISDFTQFDNHIRDNIPSGFHIRSAPVENLPVRFVNKVTQICTKIGLNIDKVLSSIGSLGGGNHFIEAGADEKGRMWITIHSGSRNFGLKVATYHQKKAEDTYHLARKQTVVDLLMEYPPEERESVRKEISDSNPPVPKGMEYLMGSNAQEYFEDMKVAQEFASINREVMMAEILKFFDTSVSPTFIESVHNYIDFNDNIIRKGAISAHKGELVVIPWNMRDGLIIGIGRGNEDWNNSAPHGAGRVMSRSQAKREINIKDFIESMESVWTSCVGSSTIDESPMAYKDHKSIEKYIEPTVEILHRVKPLYNFKAQ